jgi:hypothetical protein
MADQPEALRLAAELEAPVGTQSTYSAMQQAAAELRRLHHENERLHQINQSHEMRLSVRGYEIQIADLKAVNAELLDAMISFTNSAYIKKHHPKRYAAAIAAIARAEEQK